MKQYLDLCRRIVNEGEWVANERTGKRCLTVINADLEYDVANNQFPLITTRKSYWKAAIAEFLGYIRGYDNAADFRKLGTKTWDANANENAAWLANPHRKGTDDMGRVYGVQGRAWRKPNGETIDQLRKIVNNLSRGIDDRGEILTFFNPGEFDLGCLRPCMHTHTFSLVGDTLHLTSYQRSCDVPLGLNFNQIQVFTFLALMAQIEGNILGEGWNLSIIENDPTAHAEIVALRNAAQNIQNYRLLNTTLYVTLEPCTMCAGAILHSRIKRLVFGASDYKTGAVGSRFHFFDDYKMNHTLEITSGVLAEKCGQKLSDFFKKRREQKKEEKREKNLPLDVESQS